MKYFILCLLLGLPVSDLLASKGVRRDAFVINIDDNRFSVISPPKYIKKVNILVENNTVTKMLGKVEVLNSKKSFFITVPANNSSVIEVDTKKGETLVFVPLAPPFQKLELRFGNEQYAIPPRQEKI